MEMAMSIASLGVAMSTSRLMTDVNMALMSKTLDLAEVQGDAMQEMMQVMPPTSHMLDVYA